MKSLTAALEVVDVDFGVAFEGRFHPRAYQDSLDIGAVYPVAAFASLRERSGFVAALPR